MCHKQKSHVCEFVVEQFVFFFSNGNESLTGGKERGGNLLYSTYLISLYIDCEGESRDFVFFQPSFGP